MPGVLVNSEGKVLYDPAEQKVLFAPGCCPAVSVVCDSVQVQKCGFFNFDGTETDHYLRRGINDYTSTVTRVGPCGGNVEGAVQTCTNMEHHLGLVPDVSLDCDFLPDSHLGDCTTVTTHCDASPPTTTYGSLDWFSPPFASDDDWDVSPTSATLHSDHTFEGYRTVSSGSWYLSDPYTDEMLLEHLNDVPYPGTFGGSCSAVRDIITEGGSSDSLSKFKPKFTIACPQDIDIRIKYNEHFVPDDDGDLVDTPKTVTIAVGETEIIGDEVLAPEVNGETTLTNVRVVGACPDKCKGACCEGEDCSCKTEAECIAAEGAFQGDNVPCEEDTCTTPPGTGACCTSDGCFILSEAECISNPTGVYQGDGTTCDPDPCLGACCLDGICYSDVTQFACEVDGGTFMGSGTDCDPDPCGFLPAP